ncbi:MAG: SRPBCC domain-containing protein [Lutibacter sp.]|uniref:SRPBCC domain-containing protein n=1 Tax=Lutibacter sp. TaxID=1925666 RepID=UPI00299DCD96|nr:SRPBCC domain-containing protein [Lutibacter sp.]MDX1828658.1 SRPBCC domain-containing protein [Lutibacter sp.]
MELKTEIIINAEPSKVWEILTNFEKYPNWNPFIKTLIGDVKIGKPIKIELQGITFKPKVLTFKKEKEFSWLGHLLFKGLFDGEHSFKLIDNKNGTTKFEQSEKFSGILVPLFKKKLTTETKNGFIKMNKQLKIEAEKKL